jgi:16S rRNA (cytosine967-C5)-methyltransferase
MRTATPADTRAVAALALAEIALGGRSLREVLAQQLPQLPQPRERAFASALVFAGARGWLRWNAALPLLLQKPLSRRLGALHALLVLGLTQLEDLDVPAHAAVAATVEAARALGHDEQRGLVNAVLRRWLRERGALLARLDADVESRTRLPAWLLQAVHGDWPAQLDAIVAASNAEVPPTLRVNLARVPRADYVQRLIVAGIDARPHAWIDSAVTLSASLDVTRLPGWGEGLCAVQDGAAQLAAVLLDAPAGARVLDACAAPGGKACHILERSAVQLTALELAPARLARVRDNLTRLRLHADLRIGDATQPALWWDGVACTHILLDAPCSATGVLRRQPDVRLHRRASDLPALIAQQRALLDALWPLLAPGGILLYATCSVLRSENATQAAAFLATHADAEALPLALPAGRADGPGWQILPGEDGLDGMFYARLRKRGAC